MECYGFSDESNYTDGNYRSIALIVMPKSIYSEFQNEMLDILERYGIKITSFKWSKIQNENKVKALIEILEFLFPYLESNLIKIEVLMWNIHDTRHNIRGRDDPKNLSYMYNKLIKDYAERYLKENDLLYLFPDRNTAINWEELEDILFNQRIYKLSYIKQFNLEVGSKKIIINDSSTQKYPIIQIADIFAGMGRSSFEDYDVYERWLDPQQQVLVGTPKKPSNRQKYRFQIYKLVDNWAKENKLGISLRKNRGFLSYNILSPLNFWFYKPQHEKDKAPTRN